MGRKEIIANKPGTSKSMETETMEEQVNEEPGVVKSVAYPSPNKSNDILNKLHANRDHGEFCDIQLQISQTKTIYAHKPLLAACSPYFEGMFSSSFLEATSEVVDLSHMCDRSDVLEQIIDSFYGRSFEVNESNVSDALNLASMLMLEDLKEDCAKVLHGVLGLHNAAEMLQLSINFEINDLRDKIEPIVRSRFHDCILFQDDIYHLSIEGFECLIGCIDTSFITRREKYVEFIFKWFNLCESEERAQLLLKAIEGIKFKLTKHSYIEYKDQLEDVMNHLDEVNTDMSEESRMKLKLALSQLKPSDYVANIPMPHESSNSDVEMEPEFIMFPDTPVEKRVKYFGPPTKETAFSAEEEAAWEEAHKEMAKRDEMRRLWNLWPPSTRKDPNRPKGLRRESPPAIHKSRKFGNNSSQKQAGDLVDAVVVLTPSLPYLEKLNAKTEKADIKETDDNVLLVCAYVPCTKSWYKISELTASSIKNVFGRKTQQRKPMMDMDEMDEEDMHMMMYEMPEMMMMMGDMPHRMMREMSRSGMSPRMLRLMMERDREGMHDHMMMREMMRRHRRFGGPMDMEFMQLFRDVPALTDKLWKVQYFSHKLFFFHENLLCSVYCHDLLSLDWYQIDLKYDKNCKSDRERNYYEKIDGIDLIVMGEILYAVQRIALIDPKDDNPYKREEDRIDDAKKQTLIVKHAVFKLVGDKKEMKWEQVMISGDQWEFIDVDKKHQIVLDPKDPHTYNRGPRLKQPNCLGTTLFAEDPFKLHIISLKHKFHYNTDSPGRLVSNIETLYLDLKEHEDIRDGVFNSVFKRMVTPLVSSEYAALVNDNLELEVMIDTMQAKDRRSWSEGNLRSLKDSEFLNALETYPCCSSIMCSSRDGKRLWILRGHDDDSSELIEVTATFYRPYRDNGKINQKHHTPPPFKCFTLACTGKMDLATVKSFGLPLPYMHGSQNS